MKMKGMWVVRGKRSKMEKGIREVIFGGSTEWELTYTNFSIWSTFSKSLPPLLQTSMMISSDAQGSIVSGLEVSGFAAEQFHAYICIVHIASTTMRK